jgi:hypothetical protein
MIVQDFRLKDCTIVTGTRELRHGQGGRLESSSWSAQFVDNIRAGHLRLEISGYRLGTGNYIVTATGTGDYIA